MGSHSMDLAMPRVRSVPSSDVGLFSFAGSISTSVPSEPACWAHSSPGWIDSPQPATNNSARIAYRMRNLLWLASNLWTAQSGRGRLEPRRARGIGGRHGSLLLDLVVDGLDPPVQFGMRR